jgi:hypothetical protein
MVRSVQKYKIKAPLLGTVLVAPSAFSCHFISSIIFSYFNPPCQRDEAGQPDSLVLNCKYRVLLGGGGGLSLF